MDPFHLEITEANAQGQQEITQVSYLNLLFMISFWHSDVEYTSYVCLYSVYSPIITFKGVSPKICDYAKQHAEAESE